MWLCECVCVCMLIHLPAVVYTGRFNLSFPPPVFAQVFLIEDSAGPGRCRPVTQPVPPSRPSVMPLFSFNPRRPLFICFFDKEMWPRCICPPLTGMWWVCSAEASQPGSQIHHVIHGTVILLKSCTFAYASTAHINLSLNVLFFCLLVWSDSWRFINMLLFPMCSTC